MTYTTEKNIDNFIDYKPGNLYRELGYNVKEFICNEDYIIYDLYFLSESINGNWSEWVKIDDNDCLSELILNDYKQKYIENWDR